MPQYFRASSNTLARAGIILVLVGGAALAGGTTAWNLSPYVTHVYVPVEQPVPFSHQHHVGQLGISCIYCHSGVETSHFAGLPPTHTCMSCHSQLYTDSPMLAPVRASLLENRPLRWNRVHNLPNYVYFNHSIHVQKGVGCETCHGRVDTMPMTWKDKHMTMSWCLNCHREPSKYLRPQSAIYAMGYTTPANLGASLKADYHIKNAQQLTDCTTCHR